MPPDPFPASLDQRSRTWIWMTFLLATVFRAALVLGFPTIHGGDAAARIANANTLVLGYQLPLPQAFVVLGKAISDDPLLVRLIFSAWGGVLASGMTALVAIGLGPRAALFACLLFSFDPLTTHYSIVPYQEPVVYGLLAWAFFAAGAGQSLLGAGLMAAACLSRYEAWILLPAFIWASRSLRAALVAAAPVAGWILWWQGLAPRGLYVLDLDVAASRLSRVVYLSSKVMEYESATALVVAAAGLVLAVLTSNRKVLVFTAILALPIAVTVTLGHEYPPGSGLMSERLIHLPVLLVLSLSAFALDRLAGTSRLRFSVCLALAVLLAGRNLRFEQTLLRAAAHEPDLALARDAARAVEARRSADECVSVSAPAVDRAFLLAYVGKVAAAGGDVARAKERADALTDVSPDRDRIAAHLKARPGTVRDRAGCPLVVEVDGVRFDERPEADATSLVAEVTAGPRRARLLRIRP